MSTAPHSFEAEEKRIKAVYAARRASVPRHLYSDLNPGHLTILQEIERRILGIFRSQNVPSLASLRILEIGCWQGFWIRKFIQWGAQPRNLEGVDLLSEEIARARELSPPSVKFHCGNAADLPNPGGSFDVVCQFTVFTSVLDEQLRARMAQEMLRVLKPGGFILWYDFFLNNPRNPNVRGIKKREVVRLFPGCLCHLSRTTLAPPLARHVGPVSSLLYEMLSGLKILDSHYVGFIQKRAVGAC